MNIRKLFAIILAVSLCIMTFGAFAEDATTAELEARIAELEAQLAEKDALIAELQHQLAATNYVAEFDGGYITVEEALKEYSYVEYMYSMYGYSMEGYEDYIKNDIAVTMVEDAIVQLKAAEMGLNIPDAEKESELIAAAQSNLDMYVENYRDDFAAEGLTDEEIDAATLEFLAANAIDFDTLYAQELEYFAADNLYANVVDGIAVTDDDVKAAYDQAIADDQANYSDAYYYESAVSAGARIYWHPEGYRNVKQVLIAFSTEQTARYDEITNRLADLNIELDAAVAAADETAEARTVEVIQADIDAANAQLDALYTELEPAANEVIAKYNEGVPFDELIAIYGGDPGSIDAATGAVNTYTVSADSAMYDPAFVEAAMSTEAIGDVSAPGRGMFGLYIVCYDSDVASGAVDFESVKEDLYYEAYDLACANAYDAQVAAWCEELNVVYHLENFR